MEFLQSFSARAAKTTRMVAAGGSGGNKKLAEALLSAAGQLESLTPQLVSAGRIRLAHPSSKVTPYFICHIRLINNFLVSVSDFSLSDESQGQDRFLARSSLVG